MAEDTGLDLDSLDVSDSEIPSTPEPAPAAPDPAPAQPAAAAPEPAGQTRDPATGQFVAQVADPAAPAPAAAPAVPAAPATPAAAPSADPNANRVIPLAAHLEERNRWRQEIAARDQRLTEINQRLEKLEPKAAPPEFTEDPKGYVDGVAKQTQEEIQRLRDEATQLQNEQQFTRFVQDIGTHQATFVEKNPDYYDALNHVRGIRTTQLTLMYPTATPDQINQAIGQEELQAAAIFMQQGRNPAEGAYELARSLGYRKAEAAPAPAAPTAAAPKVDIPRAPVADPSNTLGSSTGNDPDADQDLVDDGMSAFNEALTERFGPRRA